MWEYRNFSHGNGKNRKKNNRENLQEIGKDRQKKFTS